MHTGGAPLGAYSPLPKPRELAAVPILADWIDETTGELSRFNVSRTVVDGAVIEGMRVERGTGPAVIGVGHTLRRLRYVDDANMAELPEAARDGIRELERLNLARLAKTIVVERDGDRVAARVEIQDLTSKPATALVRDFVVR